jgi:hypothetical protein
MATRAEKIRRMQSVVDRQPKAKAPPTMNDQAGLLDKAAGAVGFLRGEARRIKSRIDTTNKLRGKRLSRYVRTRRELAGKK